MFTFGNGGIVVFNGFAFCVNSVHTLSVMVILVNLYILGGISSGDIVLIIVVKIN